MRAVFNQEDLTFKLHYDINIEREQLISSFNRKIQGWRFKTKHIPGWDGDVQFISSVDKLPAGLWGQLKKVCETYKFPLKVEGFNEFLRSDLNFQHVKEYCEKLIVERNTQVSADKKIILRPYQPKAVYLSLKYRLCMNDLATSAGKTLIMFLYSSYVHEFIDKNSQILIIEPDPEYVIQSYTEINDYSVKSKSNLKIGMVSGSSSLKDVSEFDLVIGNFQTLMNREPEFFSRVKHIMIDEGHRAKTKAIKDVMKACKNAKDRVGLSGTVIDDKSADHYDVIAATGPTVIKITKKDLMDSGFAPGIKIKIFVLDYLSEEERRNIAFMKLSMIKNDIEQFDHEISLMRNNKLRMDWVANLVANLPKNSLSLFVDKKNEFGKRLYNSIRQISQKELYYIDGDVKESMREEYKKRMEMPGNNRGLLATYQTYATGKSIKNLHYIVQAEPMKSEIVVGQAIGRGMREYEDKEEFHWIDIVDDYRWEGNLQGEDVYFTNILYRQMKDRMKIYKNEKFEYEIIKVKLSEHTQPKIF